MLDVNGQFPKSKSKVSDSRGPSMTVKKSMTFPPVKLQGQVTATGKNGRSAVTVTSVTDT